MAIIKARQSKKDVSKNQVNTYYFDVEKYVQEEKVTIKKEQKLKLILLLLNLMFI